MLSFLKNRTGQCTHHKLKQLCIIGSIRNCQRPPPSQFEPIFKFPHIRKIALINKLKIYQTALTAVAVPGTAILAEFDICTLDDVTFATVVGAVGLIPLWILSFFLNKVIGFVYIDEGKERIKIAYVTFWGNRKDIIIPTKDVVPFPELPYSYFGSLYLTFRQFSTKDTKKIYVKYGTILDDDKFKYVFIN